MYIAHLSTQISNRSQCEGALASVEALNCSGKGHTGGRSLGLIGGNTYESDFMLSEAWKGSQGFPGCAKLLAF